LEMLFHSTISFTGWIEPDAGDEVDASADVANAN